MGKEIINLIHPLSSQEQTDKNQNERCRGGSTLQMTCICKGAEYGSDNVRQAGTGIAGMHDIILVIIMIITIIISKISFMLYLELVGSCLGRNPATMSTVYCP